MNLRRCLTAALVLGALFGNGGCKAEQWPLWDAYASKFIDGQGRVIDHSAADVTTTEGEAYAMFFALVANDGSRFDKLLTWTEDNMAQGDLTLHLPAWSWGKGSDGGWHVLDANPAADADLWMAYDLCEAGRLWDNDRYTKLGQLIASRIAQQEIVLIPGVGTMLLPGAEGFHPSPDTWYLNPSYLPPELLAYFAKMTPQAPWSEVLKSLPETITTSSGYAMDWMRVGSTGSHAAAPPAAEQKADEDKKPSPVATGSYDAIRVYLWLGMADKRTPGVRESIAGLRSMALYLKTHITPPEQVDATGKILNPNGPPGFSAAVVPYLQALDLKDLAAQQDSRLTATFDSKSGLYGQYGMYYDQNLAMFATGWKEKRFTFSEDGKLKPRWK